MKYLLLVVLYVLSMPSFGETKIFSPKNISTFGLTNTKQLVLTFDDGPVGTSSTGTTKSILDSLKLYNEAGYNISATFFVLGNKIKGREALLSRMKEEGHIIANHTFKHDNLRNTRYDNATTLINELLRAHTSISSFLSSEDDPDKRWYFRAPFGAWRNTRAEMLNKHTVLRNYIGPLFWTIGGVLEIDRATGIPLRSADWNCWSKRLAAKTCAHGYIRQTEKHKGGVVLFHDINIKTAEMLKYLLVTWTGFNAFKDAEYESLARTYNVSRYDFVSLDDLDALDTYDQRILR